MFYLPYFRCNIFKSAMFSNDMWAIPAETFIHLGNITAICICWLFFFFSSLKCIYLMFLYFKDWFWCILRVIFVLKVGCYHLFVFGPNYQTWRKCLFTWIKLPFFFFFFLLCLLSIPTLSLFLASCFKLKWFQIRAICKIQTSTRFSVHSLIFSLLTVSKPSAGCFSLSDACAWKFLHCFFFAMQFSYLTWTSLEL